MNRISKPVLAIIVLALIGVMVGVNYWANRPAPPSDEHTHEQEQKPAAKPPADIPAPDVKPEHTVGSVKIYLIRTTGENLSLVVVNRGVPESLAKNKLQAAGQLLCNGTSGGEDAESPLPMGTQLIWVKQEGDTVVANFSDELIRNFPGGSAWEAMVVSAIAKTFCQFPSVRRVQILVEGK